MIVERPEYNKLTGFYFGTVLWHLPHGKLKVFIHGVYSEDLVKNPAALPTAVQMTPLFAGNSNGDGCFSYPNIGATVVCSFLNGDQNFPIVLGAIQGGPNEFNQYNYVKHLGEISADRHMITTGNTHVRFHDDGQINILLQRPFDNTASIDFKKQDDAANEFLKIASLCSVNALSSFPIQSLEKEGISEPVKDDINNKDVSSLNCRYSITDMYNYGALSASEHYYDFGDNVAYWQPISGSSIATSSYSTNSIYDLAERKFNNELNDVNLSSFDTYQSSFNSVDYQAKTVYKEDFKKENKQYSQSIQVLSSFTDLKNQTDYISSYMLTDSQAQIYKYSDMSKHNMNWTRMNLGFGNSFGSTSKVDSSDINGTIAIFNNLSANSILDMPLGQILQAAVYNYKLQINDSTIVYNNSYSHNVDLSNHAVVETVLNGYCEAYSSIKYMVLCREIMDAENGLFEIQIRNKENQCECRITMNKKGIAEIQTTDEINISSKKISITGDNIAINGKTVNLAGQDGDCVIGSVSLLNHKHIETQAGDIVAPQPTQTAVASN